MARNKSILLEEIHSALRENILNINLSYPGNHSEPTTYSTTEIAERMDSIRDFMPMSKVLQSIARLEQKIEVLEKQNDNLLYFIHFIYENFDELVTKKIFTGRNKVTATHTPFSSAEKNTGPTPEITRREAEVLSHLVKGLCVKEIASILYISESTVITHKKNLMEKFHARNTVDLISKAFYLNAE